MICPNCSVQMHQKNKLGGGISTDDEYTTWEVKECPECGRVTRESYSVKVLSKSELRRIEAVCQD